MGHVAVSPPAVAAKLPTPSVPRPAVDSIDKADQILISIIDEYTNAQGTEEEKLQAARTLALNEDVLMEDQDEVVLDIEVESKADADSVTTKITAMGGFVDDTEEIAGSTLLLAAVPLKAFVTYSDSTTKNNFLRELGATKGVKLINLPFTEDPQGLAGLSPTLESLQAFAQTAKNEGVKIMGADKWQAAGITGKGVTIGIIDSGYKFIDQLKGSFLPSDFTVKDISQDILKEDSASKGVHGTAVSEIIYSLVPDAKIIATSISGSNAEFSTAIDYLVAQKVDFISVSMGNNSTPEDGNSDLSKKIEDVHNKTGIVFFMAAGNEGQEHYAQNFTPNAQGFHQWVTNVDRMAVGNPTDNPLATTILLRWDQWLNGDVNPQAADFDLIIEDEQGKVVATSDGDQRVRPPLEGMRLNIPAKTLLYVRVRLKDGTQPPAQPVRLHIFVVGGIPPQFMTSVMTVGTSADSRGAIGVGAVDPPDGDTIAGYSSQGPLSDGRMKPEICGPGGVSSAAYEANGGSKFNGTSAATPEISGLAALIKSGDTTLTSLQVVQILLENAKPLPNLPSPNTVCGYGRADLTQLSPGPLKPKGNLAPPLTNTSPTFPLDQATLYPSPVPSK
ncbi:MAG: S8 family serine peptidase [Chloroflexi bacterium]|nr:S8 family serine peptidase [Chloroflexota bacterium]